MSTPTTTRMLDGIESYYAYVRSKMLLLNSNQRFQGIVNTQDWPQIELDTNGALYLVYLTSVPQKGQSTPSQTYYEHFLQWTWVFMGADIAAGQVTANRGNRWQSSMEMNEWMRQSHFPGFCPKQFSTVNATDGDVTFSTYNPIETVTWTTPKVLLKPDNQKSGLQYGVATVQVFSYSDVLPIVNP